MRIKLNFIDGCYGVWDEKGYLIGYYDEEGTLLYEEEDCQDICGIWHDDQKCTIPWEEVVDYKDTDFQLTSGMYLDNGQVMREGLIVSIEIDGEIIWDTNNGGCDTAGWENTDDNVYCEECEISYKIVAKEGYTPHKCTFCGSGDIILREDISASQSELAKNYSRHIRSTAPWILGED